MISATVKLDGSIVHMHAVEVIIAIGWATFWIYWLVMAFSAKRSHVPWSRELRIRALIFIMVILLFRVGAFQHRDQDSDPWRVGAGLAFFAFGLWFAIWARVHIGRNWGTPMSRKDAPELVTSGPYRLVRHPIYSGILLAGVGTAIALNWLWIAPVLLAGMYFVYSANVEEHYLTEQFPDTYPVYRRSTKMLVPFIF
jgi:protein-S-isoprenylcysteine O-methyltransferase Ste14